jgi:EmrB/QacA subfamily drug resistance transporter
VSWPAVLRFRVVRLARGYVVYMRNLGGVGVLGARVRDDSSATTSGAGFGSPAQSVALATLCLVLFLTFLDNTIVSVALANVQQALHAGVTSLQWVVNGYALTFAALMLAAGVLGDQLGRKRVMLTGVGVFCAGSVVCALAANPDMLVAGRVVMGVGAAASEPGTLSVLRHVYPEKESRADALGVWAAVAGLALALGPLVGGGLVGLWDWRAIFWFNLGVGVVAMAMALRFVPESSDPRPARFDIAGVVLGVCALGAASAAVIQGEVAGYGDPVILALFCISAVAAVAFVIIEARSPRPLFNLHYLKRPAFSGSTFVAFAIYFGVFAIFFFTALCLQVVAGASPLRTAVDFLPLAVGMILAAVLTGPVVGRIGPRLPMVVGCLLTGVGILLTNHILGPHVAFSALGWTLGLVGIGFGMVQVPVTQAALTAVPPEDSGMAASTTNTSRELGAVFGVAVLGSLVNAHLTGQLATRLKAIGIPPHFQNVVITAITTGQVPASSSPVRHSSDPGIQKLINDVINAAYRAFGDGLHQSLTIAAALTFCAAVVAALTIRPGRGGHSYEL